MITQRLSPADLKALIKSKGWSGKALAKRWAVSEAWVSKIMNNPSRPAHWDDAARGLPDLRA